MADPLTALMYAVQVMNFLKTLILRTLREREDSVVESTPVSRLEPFDESGHQSPSQSCVEDTEEDNKKAEQAFIAEEPVIESSCNSGQNNVIADGEDSSSTTSVQKLITNGDQSCETAAQVDSPINETDVGGFNGLKVGVQASAGKSKIGQSSDSNIRKGPSRINRQQSVLRLPASAEKTRGISNLSRIDSRTERIEAWR